MQTLPSNLCDNPDYLASENFVSFAVDCGWYKPDAGQPFNVISVYARERPSDDQTAIEARRVEAAVRAVAGKVDVQLLMEQLRETARDSSGYGQVAHLRAGIHSDLRGFGWPQALRSPPRLFHGELGSRQFLRNIRGIAI